MTIEEAIRILENRKKQPFISYQQQEAFQMGIDALEKQIIKPTDRHIKPCPFCGSEAILKVKPDGFSVPVAYSAHVTCIKCNAMGKSYLERYAGHDFDERAVDAWNRRIPC